MFMSLTRNACGGVVMVLVQEVMSLTPTKSTYFTKNLNNEENWFPVPG